MFQRKKFDKRTGIYRTSDRIDNFCFRITLKTLNSFVKVPNFDPEQLADAEDLDEIESYDFQWQQKRFSDAEVRYYGDKTNCITNTAKQYHQQLIRISEITGGIPRKVFSYVNDDGYHESRNGSKIENLSGQDDTTSVGVAEWLSKNDSEQAILKTRPDELNGFETMFIMAHLGRDILLFTIKYWSSDKLLLVYPDFNHINVNPYLEENISDSRHSYQFSIENLSSDMRCDDDWSLRADIELMVNKLSQLFNKSSILFNMPPKRCTHINVCIEIETAKHFEYDCIHIKYNVILPNRCEIINESEKKGSTHSSQRNVSTGFWLIGHCHELNILCHHGYRTDDLLKIVFEVVSIDDWERERTEGYACVGIPLMAGCFREKIRCSRDLENHSWTDSLRRYLIGGRREVPVNQFNNFDADGSNHIVSALNRYGYRTETTGYLNIMRNVIVQRRADTEACSPKNSINKHRREAKIYNLMATYHEARERLEAINE